MLQIETNTLLTLRSLSCWMCACFSVSLSIFHGEETSLVKLEISSGRSSPNSVAQCKRLVHGHLSSSNLPHECHEVLISDEAVVEM